MKQCHVIYIDIILISYIFTCGYRNRGASKATTANRNTRSATFVDGTYDTGSYAGA